MTENTTALEASSAKSQWPHGSYVVGMDGSKHSQYALRATLTLAALTGARVEAVTAWTYPAFYGEGYVSTDWTFEGDASETLNAAIKAVVGSEDPANVTPTVREGTPTAVLLEQSKDADLLVVGSRGHGGFAGLLLGSVSAACAEHARCPVLIIHGAPVE